MIRRRASELSPVALTVGRALVIPGPDVDEDALITTLGVGADVLTQALAALNAAAFVTSLRFEHDVVLEAFDADTPVSVRRWLSRAAAASLESRGADPARVAQLWMSGGESARAAPLLRQAARDADALLNQDEAGRLRRLADSIKRD